MPGAGGEGLLVNTLLLTIFHADVNCLTNKVNYILDLINKNDIDMFCISESWLTETILDQSVEIDGFKFMRKDSPSGIRKHGVALYYKNSIKIVEVPVPIPNILCVHLIDFNLFCLVVYRPPTQPTQENDDLVRFMSAFCEDKETIIMGDFNLPSLKWNNNFYETAYCTPNDRKFLDCFTSLGLSQVVQKPTHFPAGNTLDLCLVSDAERVASYEVSPPMPGCSHGVVSVKYTFQAVASDIFTASPSRPKKCGLVLFLDLCESTCIILTGLLSCRV